MAFRFSTPRRFQSGDLFLGVDNAGQEVGISTERHAVTVAGSGAGKGAALIIPNLKRWWENALVVDPKGENAEATWQDREAMGQIVGVLDPYRVANVPDRLRVSINPLASIDPDSLTAGADCDAIADGLIVRSDPKHEEWYAGACTILSGVMAFVIADAPPHLRTFASVRRLLLQPKEQLYEDAQRMLTLEACGGKAKAAGASIIAALDSEKGQDKEFLSKAQRQSAWLDEPAIAAVLGASTFDLSALKRGQATLYLVLPPQYLDTKAAFLRLFVRSAINAMASGGQKGNRCLFLLDEFHSLGRLEIVAKAAGLMRSYGLQLWPFLQDLGQLRELYRAEGEATFFGNADAHIFFGNNDPLTLGQISANLGRVALSEIDARPASRVTYPNEREIAEDANTMRAYQHAMNRRGEPRFAPDEIARLVAKGDGDKVARSMIVFSKGEIFNLRLAPYFAPMPAALPGPPPPAPPQPWLTRRNAIGSLAFAGGALALWTLLCAYVWAKESFGAAVFGWLVVGPLFVGLIIFIMREYQASRKFEIY